MILRNDRFNFLVCLHGEYKIKKIILWKHHVCLYRKALYYFFTISTDEDQAYGSKAWRY